ncbi:hypothetical protein [Rhodanobacter sp. Root561]|uniref:hypothetical protein n=1 Tax=Rhodanobacter sp. Root561 TaxID=1736560 RepID=UPI0012FAEB8F|nr:hypothetical protein [Rhodanobacter sp. Root561]
MRKYCRSLATLLLVTAAGPALSQTPPELAAEQVAQDANASGFPVGRLGIAEQKFAQGFHLHETGVVTHLMLPLNCTSAPEVIVVRVTIQSLRNTVPAASPFSARSPAVRPGIDVAGRSRLCAGFVGVGQRHAEHAHGRVRTATIDVVR